ncbi:hypothetical protein QBC42DRAFT_21439 [Cladorrhinum samala]|uniref:J domain-containing protein n=1 Tax=Cladorrhinum samala TaxID=585594 RepID=A0AAV9HCX9_9PEZI|nr:hypothetical protein QBC42DRAFT_21439 [Cladorrhinum samala]
MPDASTSGASATDGNARNRTAGGGHQAHNQGNQERKCTPEQRAAVLRIRKCSPTAFYEILEISKTCTDAEVKKAYRKQSLLTHPDKNGHEHADEAFKMVSRAFGVLGDKEKRDQFDRSGRDPDSRFANAQAHAAAGGGHPFAGFGGGGGGRPMWAEQEISPEEMFARFFGGGGGFGGPFAGFDGGPQFVFNFGGPGVRVHRFGGPRPRARPRNPADQQEEEGPNLWNTIMGLLPIIILFIFPLISSIFSGITSGPAPPTMYFDAPHAEYTMERTMPNLNVKYYLDPRDVQSWTKNKLHSLDQQAEIIIVQELKRECEKQTAHKQRLRDEATGWFYQDPNKMAVAEAFTTPACTRLNSLRVR